MSLRHAILGFLSVQPMSGYDLRKTFAASVGHFWTADQAQIYRTLARLMADRLVKAHHIEQRGKPDRNEHLLTDAGRRELAAWLAAPAEQQLAELQAIDAEVEQAYAGRSIDLDQRLRIATLDNGIKHSQAEIEWVTTLLGQIPQEHS